MKILEKAIFNMVYRSQEGTLNKQIVFRRNEAELSPNKHVKRMRKQRAWAMAVVITSTAVIPATGYDKMLDQGLNEPRALRNCYAAIRDKIISSIEECSRYVRFHAPLYADIDQTNPYIAACEFSKYALSYATKYHLGNQILMNNLIEQKEIDCSHENK